MTVFVRPCLEILEDRTCPDTTPIDPGMLLAQMQSAVALGNQALALVNSLLPAPQPTLAGNLQGLLLTTQLDALITQQFATFIQDLAPVLIASTLGPRG